MSYGDEIRIRLKAKENKPHNLKRVRFMAKGKFSSTGLVKLKLFQVSSEEE